MASKKNKNSSQDDEYDEQIYIRTRDVPIYILRNRMNNMSLSPEERREARRKLVLKMGAKMPRVRPLNYAVYQENKRQEKASEASGLRDVCTWKIYDRHFIQIHASYFNFFCYRRTKLRKRYTRECRALVSWINSIVDRLNAKKRGMSHLIFLL